MPGLDFPQPDPLRQAALNLFNIWGYRFYRRENEFQADDQLIRSKVAAILGGARKNVETSETAYRREMLPPPSRAQPRHDPAALAGARTLERLSRAIGMLQSLIGTQPVPDPLRLPLRAEDRAEALKKLLEWDEILVSQAEFLRAKLAQKEGAWVINQESALLNDLQAITESIQNRQHVLEPLR